jgi:hypothetical protein
MDIGNALSGLQIRLLPFVQQLPLFSCPAVQAEPCHATCANATLDMNQLVLTCLFSRCLRCEFRSVSHILTYAPSFTQLAPRQHEKILRQNLC